VFNTTIHKLNIKWWQQYGIATQVQLLSNINYTFYTISFFQSSNFKICVDTFNSVYNFYITYVSLVVLMLKLLLIVMINKKCQLGQIKLDI